MDEIVIPGHLDNVVSVESIKRQCDQNSGFVKKNKKLIQYILEIESSEMKFNDIHNDLYSLCV